MYYKKRLICVDKSGNAIYVVTISGEGGMAKVRVSPTAGVDEVVFVIKGVACRYQLPCDSLPYFGEDIECALLYHKMPIAYSKGADFSITQEKREETLEKIVAQPTPPPTVDKTIKYDTTVKQKEPAPQNEDIENIENNDTLEDTKIEDSDVAHFYCSVKQKLEETFTCYPTVNVLEDMIPNSRWVEIKKSDTPYVIGLVNERDKPRYLCYGVSCNTGNLPPPQIEKYCQWLPLDDYKGYWIIFQDANTGETLEKE